MKNDRKAEKRKEEQKKEEREKERKATRCMWGGEKVEGIRSTTVCQEI